MLRSIKDMLDYSILATDGEIGHVSDILLGESDLKVRYLVIDTGGWLSGRKVLLSTAWLSSVAPHRKALTKVSDWGKRLAAHCSRLIQIMPTTHYFALPIRRECPSPVI